MGNRLHSGEERERPPLRIAFTLPRSPPSLRRSLTLNLISYFALTCQVPTNWATRLRSAHGRQTFWRRAANAQTVRHIPSSCGRHGTGGRQSRMRRPRPPPFSSESTAGQACLASGDCRPHCWTVLHLSQDSRGRTDGRAQKQQPNQRGAGGTKIVVLIV